MEEQILNEILKDTFTLDSLKKRVQVLKLILEREIYRPAQQNSASELEVREENWLSGFNKKLITGMTSDMLGHLNEHIDTFISNIKALTIYFVFNPDEAQIKEIGTWLRKNLDQPRLVFDFKVDPALIGGCALVYKGIYKDYSLRAKVHQNREQLISEFKKYFQQ